MIPQDFAYDFPERAYLLFLLPLILLLFVWLNYGRKKKLERFTSLNLVVPQEKWISWTKLIALSMTWLFATLAFMQPKGNAHYPKGENPVESNAELRLKSHEVFFLVDASASMSIKDGRDGKTRLEQAQEITDEVISLLEGESAALYAFTSNLSKLSPLTTDYFFVRLMLRNIQIDEGGIPGTNFLASLSKLPETAPEKLKTVILLSDGGDTLLESLPSTQQQARIQDILDLFKNQRNLRIYTIGIGKNEEETIPGIKFQGRPVQSALDNRILLALANQGTYYKANDASAIQISRDIASKMRRERVLFDDAASVRIQSKELLYDYYYQIPLAIALLLLSYVLLFPDNLRLKHLTAIFLFLLPLQGYTQDLNLAKTYAEAGDTEEALTLYDQALKETAELWKKNILLYNKGLVLLKEQSWQKAIDAFQSVESDDNPLLASYLRRNLALACYQRAVSIEPKNAADYLQQIYQLRDSLQQISLAKQADCDLQKLEGNPHCNLDKGLNAFRDQVKTVLSQTLKNYGSYHSHYLSMQEGLPELLYSVSVLKENANFLLQTKVPPSYHIQFREENSSWIPLWRTIKTQLSGDQKVHFAQADEIFSDALNTFNSQDYSTSLMLAERTEKLLNDLLKTIWGNALPQEVLQHLVSMYEQISVRDTLPEAFLMKLQDLQKRTAPLLSQELKEPLQKAVAFLGLSLDSLNQSSPALARLYFEAARFTVMDLLPKEELSPKQALQKAIDRQEHAKQLNQIRLQNDKIPQEATALISQAQKGVLDQARSFLKVVFKTQQVEFEKGKCERKPWDIFLPAFNLGYVSAGEALGTMREKPNEAISKQEETLLHWKQLRQDMDTPPKQEEKEQKEMSHVLQRLQEMSQDDEIKKKTTTKQQVERPW